MSEVYRIKSAYQVKSVIRVAATVIILLSLFIDVSAQNYSMTHRDSVMVHISKARRAMIPALESGDTVQIGENYRRISALQTDIQWDVLTSLELEQLRLILGQYEALIDQLITNRESNVNKTVFSRDKLEHSVLDYLKVNMDKLEAAIAASDLAPDEKYALTITLIYHVIGFDFSDELRTENLEFPTTYPNSELKNYIKRRFPNLALPFTTSFHFGAEFPLYSGDITNNFESIGVGSSFGIDISLKRFYVNLGFQMGSLQVSEPFELVIGEKVREVTTSDHFNRLSFGVGLGYGIVMNKHLFLAPTFTLKSSRLQSSIFTEISGLQEIDLYNGFTYGAEIMARIKVMTFNEGSAKSYSFFSVLIRAGVEVPTHFDYEQFESIVFPLEVGLVFGIGSR